MSENPKAFVIMPFDPEFTPIFEQLIKPALEESGYDVRRADSFFDQENIIRDIVRGISKASLVIAELTVPNPNVYYELGLCHGLKIPAVLIAQSIDVIPFDLRSYRILIYSTQFDKVGKLKLSLTDIGNKHKNHELKFGSPVTDFLEVDNNIPIATTQNIQAVTEIQTIEPTEESGFLDFMIEGQLASEKMTVLMNKIAESTLEIGQKIKSHTERIEAISNNPGPGMAAQAQKVALLVSKDMDNYSNVLEELLPELESSVETMAENYTGYTKWFALLPQNNKGRVIEWRNQIDALRTGAKTGLTGIRSFRDSTVSLLSMSISREINKSSRHLSLVLEKVITEIEKVEAFCTKSLLIVDEKIEQKDD